jgi:hypothetical protein
MEESDVLPEFYLLSFLERRHSSSVEKDREKRVVSVDRGGVLRLNNTEALSQIASSVGNGSLGGTSSVALSSRAAKQKHDTIARLRRVETKFPKMTLGDKVLLDMHAARRKLYSRGHCVPAPGRDVPKHPVGAAPVVLRDHEMGSSGRFATTSRPKSASAQFSPIKLNDRSSARYVRPTQRLVLNSRGGAIAEDCARSSWRFKRPLDSISMPRPSTFASSLQNAPLPDCAECVLTEGPYATLAGAARARILEKTTNADRLYLVASRGGAMTMPPAHFTTEAPYSVDYAPPRSPERRKRDVWKKSPFDKS